MGEGREGERVKGKRDCMAIMLHWVYSGSDCPHSLAGEIKYSYTTKDLLSISLYKHTHIKSHSSTARAQFACTSSSALFLLLLLLLFVIVEVKLFIITCVRIRGGCGWARAVLIHRAIAGNSVGSALTNRVRVSPGEGRWAVSG